MYAVFLRFRYDSAQTVERHRFASQVRPAPGACIIFLRRPMSDDAHNWCLSSYSHKYP